MWPVPGNRPPGTPRSDFRVYRIGLFIPIFFKISIYLFLAVPGLHCCVGFSLVAVLSGGFSLVAVHNFGLCDGGSRNWVEVWNSMWRCMHRRPCTCMHTHAHSCWLRAGLSWSVDLGPPAEMHLSAPRCREGKQVVTCTVTSGARSDAHVAILGGCGAGRWQCGLTEVRTRVTGSLT